MSSTLAAAFLALAPLPAAGQDMTVTAENFDVDRAMLTDAPMFDPYYPTELGSLRAARADGLVDDETPLLVLDVAGRRLALLTAQMAYHHVAQGEMAGEPWLVTF